VVRPGTGVVRPGTGVVRPPSADGSVKASAAVPDAPEKPLEPIHVVLPEIPVMPVKQGFLDKLVAGKSEAEKEAERLAEEARKLEEEQRKAEEEARKAEEAARKEAEKARKEAEEAWREQQEAEEKARAKAEEAARKEAEKAREKAEKARRAQEKARRRAEEKARRAAEAEADEDEDLDDDEDDDDEDYDEPVPPPRGYAGPSAPPRPGPPPAPPRPAPTPAPPRPGTRPGPGGFRPYPPGAPAGRPQRVPDRRYDDRYGYDDRWRGPAPAPRRSPWRWVATAAALVALGSGSAVAANALGPGEAVGFNPGLDLGTTVPILGAAAQGLPQPSAAGLESALGTLLADARLGTPVMTVVDAATGRTLWGVGADTAVIPASAQKVMTAAAVLATRGPNYRIPTRVVQGSGGDIVIVGNGDPTLARGQTPRYDGAAHLSDLADQVRQALGGATPSRIVVDISAFDPTTVGPYTEADVTVEKQVSYITALMTDGGLVNALSTSGAPDRQSQPHLAAARAFAAALGVPNVPVVEGSAPSGAKVLGEVFSPPISRIVERMLVDSDNTLAEMMAHQIAMAKGMPASFEGGAAATRSALEGLGVPTPAGLGLVDGSGLSYGNKVTANQIAAVLVKATSGEYPQLSSILSGLPVAGYYGTLDQAHSRDLGSGRGYVRAKTGTLNGVNSLAGIAVDARGRTLIFVVIANNTPGREATRVLDRIGEALATCGCA